MSKPNPILYAFAIALWSAAPNMAPTHSLETLNGNIYVRKETIERGDDDV